MFPPVAKKKCSLVRPVSHCELSQESSLKQILQAEEQSKHVTDVKEVIANLLILTASQSSEITSIFCHLVRCDRFCTLTTRFAHSE